MSTLTSTTTHTRTHTATYLSDVIMGAIGDILGSLGIDASRFFTDWDQDQSAIAAWINEGSLKEVILECHRPDDTVKPVFEFPLIYGERGPGGASFVNSRAALARYQAKLTSVPYGTKYHLFCTFSGPRTPQPGWSTGQRSSTDGLRSTSFGSLAEGPHARANLRYLN
jgi:Bacterial HORMA domain 2